LPEDKEKLTPKTTSIEWGTKTTQGCGPRKITRSPKVPHHEILGAQHLNLYEKSKFL